MITRKKVIWCLVVVIILVGVTVVFLPFDSPSSQTSLEEETVVIEPTVIEKVAVDSVPTMVPERQSDTTAVTQVPTQLINPAQRWKTYLGETFRFQHPKDWTPQPFTMSEGGISILVKPLALPEGINYPQFILQTQPAAPDVIGRKEGVLAGFGMTKETVMLDGAHAIKYKGTIPYKIVGQQVVNEPIQDTTYLLEKNGTVYVLKFEYEGATADGALDDFFDGFILSFKTN